jgi:hypothetical protein
MQSVEELLNKRQEEEQKAKEEQEKAKEEKQKAKEEKAAGGRGEGVFALPSHPAVGGGTAAPRTSACAGGMRTPPALAHSPQRGC